MAKAAAAPLGYSGTPLPKKLGLKDGQRALFIDLPKSLASLKTSAALVAADAGINLFFASWLVRRKDPENPSPKALALAGLGGLALTAVGWLGGELVQRMGVSVAPGAGLTGQRDS